MNNTAYIIFLLKLVEQLKMEDAQRNTKENCCYLCNTLGSPLVTRIVRNPDVWKIQNAFHIKRLKDAIQRKIQRFNRREDVKQQQQFKAHTLTLPLDLQFPGASHLERRCLWLEKLAKDHSTHNY